MPSTSFTTSVDLPGTQHRLLGFSVAETAGASAQVEIHDAAGASNLLIGPITLAPNESTRESIEPFVLSAGSIYVSVVGTVKGAIRWD